MHAQSFSWSVGSTLSWVAIATLACAQTCWSADAEAEKVEGPPKAVQITIAKDTTRILEPLGKDGLPDYVAALEQRIRKGVTPENNVATALWQTLGPSDIDEASRDAYFRRLGIPVPPEDGDYLVSFYEILNTQFADDDAKYAVLEAQYERAMVAPWTKKDAPELAAWLEGNDKNLDRMVEASRRDHYYSPLLLSEGDEESSMLIAVMLPAISHFREVARGLSIRAMLRVGEGELDAAWEDVLACHRLARLTGQGTTLIDALVSAAVDSVAWRTAWALAHHGKPTAEQVRKFRKQLAALAPLPSMIEKVDVAERFMYLDCVCTVARAGPNQLKMIGMLGDGDVALDPAGQLQAHMAKNVIDWDEVLRMGNKFYDRLVAAGRMKDSTARAKAFDAVNEDIEKIARAVKVGILGAPLLALGGEQGKKMLSRQIGGIMISLLMPALGTVLEVEHRTNTQIDMEHLALALAAYRAEHGAYPDELSKLTPKHFPQIPTDAFTGAPLRYVREGDNYVLYSIGPNAKDDGGRDRDSEPSGDDIVIRTADES